MAVKLINSLICEIVPGTAAPARSGDLPARVAASGRIIDLCLYYDCSSLLGKQLKLRVSFLLSASTSTGGLVYRTCPLFVLPLRPELTHC